MAVPFYESLAYIHYRFTKSICETIMQWCARKSDAGARMNFGDNARYPVVAPARITDQIRRGALPLQTSSTVR